MSTEEAVALDLVKRYQALVLQYSALDKQIDQLIMAHGGASENLSPEDRLQYRAMAQQRDEIQNEMHEIEVELNISEG
jgi:hypothetical protein